MSPARTAASLSIAPRCEAARGVPCSLADEGYLTLTDVMGVPAFEGHEGPELMYEQVADHIEARIRTGEIPPGARLPGEQALRQEYGVALSTVRKAMGLLRDRGLVTTRASKGTFVRREIPPPE